MSEGGDEDEESSSSVLVEHFLAPIVVSLIIGLLTGYLATRVSMASLKTEVDHLNGQVEALKDFNHQLMKQREEVNKSLAEIKTKLDLLMQNKELRSRDESGSP